jgi:SAM-dependent methyltransferase
MINVSAKQISKDVLKHIAGEMHIGQRTRKMHLLRALKRLNANGKIILDAGCGGGDYAFVLAQKYPHSVVKGIELNQIAYESCKQKNSLLELPNVTFIHRDLCEPFGNSKYHLILSVDVMEHIEDDDKVLENMFLALRAGGQLLLHVPLVEKHIFKKIREMPRQPDHVRDGYEEKDLLKKLKDNGFIIIEKRYTFARYRGALAWEIWKLFSQKNILIQLVLHPFVVFLSWMDGVAVNKKGGGILILTQKCVDKRKQFFNSFLERGSKIVE